MFRASGCAPLFTGTDGLSDTQSARLAELYSRKEAWRNEEDEKAKKKLALTEKMESELSGLLSKMEDFNNGIVELSVGAKTFVKSVVRKEFYKYKSAGFGGNKTTEKGNVCEDVSIEFMNVQLLKGWRKLIEGDEFFSLAFNYMTGHPDVIDQDDKEVIDIKTPWSKDTFPDFSSDSECELYTWQIRAYLYMLIGMTGCNDWRKGKVIHVLVDTPEELVPEWEPDDLHDMSDVADHLRYTIVNVSLTDDHIAHMERRINAAVKYADEYRELLMNKNKS